MWGACYDNQQSYSYGPGIRDEMSGLIIKVNGALRKCYAPSVQGKVLFFWWEFCHFIRYDNFLSRRVEILVCVKWLLDFPWFAGWILDKKNKSYGRCQLFSVGLHVEICTTVRASQSINMWPEWLFWQLRAEYLRSGTQRQKLKQIVRKSETC